MSCRSLVLGAPLLAGLSALTGCMAPQDGAAEPVSAAEQAIMGGTADPGDQNVVDIVWNSSQGQGFCSGSLLAPNMVLTAHHCVANLQGPAGSNAVDCASTSFSAPDPASHFQVSTKEFLTQGGFHSVKEVLVAPPTGTSKICGVDQAILILADDVKPTEAVPLVPRVDVALTPGETYTAIGFGITSDTASDNGTRRRVGGLKVTCVGKGCFSLPQYPPGTMSPDHEWGGDPGGTKGTCEGDSGGPQLDGLNRVIGVVSRGYSGCTYPVYGDVYAWRDWIKATALHAATVGGYTAPSWATGYPTDPAYSYPVGGDCSDPTTCPSNSCLADSAGFYCTRLCEDAAPCPDGYTCTTVQSQQYCQRNPAPVVQNPGASSGCSVQAADPTKPVPWLLGVGLGALALLRRRRSR